MFGSPGSRLHRVLAVALTCVVSTASQAQVERLAYEAVSIKPNRSMAVDQDLDLQAGGRLTATNVPVSRLISGPYGVQEFQIVGLPGWATSERFDIVARPNGNPSDEQSLLMLKSLLEDRFRLIAHQEQRERQVFALTLARSDRRLGPGLRQAPPCTPGVGTDRPCRAYRTANGLIQGVGNTIPRFAGVLERFVGNKVIDRTSLTGTYDLQLEWTPEVRSAARVDAAMTGQAIFTALREQLGLKLESTKAMIDVLVVDRIERPLVD